MLLEREREMMEVKARLEGENTDLQRNVDEKNKVHVYMYVYNRGVHLHSYT